MKLKLLVHLLGIEPDLGRQEPTTGPLDRHGSTVRQPISEQNLQARPIREQNRHARPFELNCCTDSVFTDRQEVIIIVLLNIIPGYFSYFEMQQKEIRNVSRDRMRCKLSCLDRNTESHDLYYE